MMLVCGVDLSCSIRDVVEAYIAENVVSRILGFDVLCLAANDDCELNFPVQLDAWIRATTDGVEGTGQRKLRFEKTSGSVGVGTLSSWMCFL